MKISTIRNFFNSVPLEPDLDIIVCNIALDREYEILNIFERNKKMEITIGTDEELKGDKNEKER